MSLKVSVKLTLQGKKVATLPALGKEWTVTFDLTPSEMPVKPVSGK